MADLTAAIYIRVSTEEQADGWSLDAQRALCQALAKQRGWSVYQVYTEPGQSAKTDRRPVFQRLLRDMERQRFDVIVVHKLDRFSRSLPDVVNHVALLKRVKVGFVSVSESWIDTTTPMGEIMLYLCALLAQWDNENRARETAKGKAARAQGGLWNGSLSFGYTTLRALKQERLAFDQQHQAGELETAAYQLVIGRIEGLIAQYPGLDERTAILHPEQAAAVEMLFNIYGLGTFSDNDAAQLLNEEGYRTRQQALFTADTVREMLQNRFYLGETKYKGQALPGSHPALVTPELFAKAQEVRATRRGRREKAASTKRCYPLKGLTYCAYCGRPLRGQASARHRYYRDSRRAVHNCPQRQIRAEVAEQAVIDILSSLQLVPDWRERMLIQEITTHPELAELEQTRAKLERQRDNAYQLCKAGDMPYDEYAAIRDNLNRQLQRLQPVCEDEVEAAAALLGELPTLVTTATPEDLQLIFHATLKAVELDSQAANPVVAVEFHPAVQRLLDLSQDRAQALPVPTADTAPSIDLPEVMPVRIGPVASQQPTSPQDWQPCPVDLDKRQGNPMAGSLKRTAPALKDRLFGDLRLLLGCLRGDRGYRLVRGMATLPSSTGLPLHAPI